MISAGTLFAVINPVQSAWEGVAAGMGDAGGVCWPSATATGKMNHTTATLRVLVLKGFLPFKSWRGRVVPNSTASGRIPIYGASVRK